MWHQERNARLRDVERKANQAGSDCEMSGVHRKILMGRMRFMPGARISLPLLVATATCALFPAGCGQFFTQGFIKLIDPEGASTAITLNNPSGHVVIQFVNNAEIDERLISYLETPDGGNLALTDAQKLALQPRFRFDVLITYQDASQSVLQIEFETAPDAVLEPGCIPADANFPVEDNYVVICDVLQIELLQDTLEVLVPVAIDEYQLQQFTTVQGGISAEYALRDELPCGWRTLQLDDDRSAETPLQRNVDPRTLPGIVFPKCGDVITFEITGQLRVPFLTAAEQGPSYDIASESVVAGIGGRFEVRADLRRQ